MSDEIYTAVADLIEYVRAHMLYLVALTDIVMAAVFVSVLWSGYQDHKKEWMK